MKHRKFTQLVLVLYTFLIVMQTAAQAENIESQIMQIREIHQSGNLQKAAFMKRALLLKLPQDFYKSENEEDINFLMNYVVDEYALACTSVADGAGNELESDVKEYLIAHDLSEEQIKEHLVQKYIKYGKDMSSTSHTIEKTLEWLSGNKAHILPYYVLSGVQTYIPGVNIYAMWKTWSEYKKNKENHQRLQQTLQAEKFFSYGKDSRIYPSWENAVLSYKKLSERASAFNTLHKKIVEQFSNVPNSDLFIKLEADQTERTALLYHLDQILRYLIFDWPTLTLCYKSQLEVMDAKGIIMDDDDKIQESGLAFSRYTKFFGYTVQDNTRKTITETMKLYKEELSKKKYEELVSKSRFLTDPLGLPQKVEVAWP